MASDHPSSSRCRVRPRRRGRAGRAGGAGDHEAYAALLRPHERVAYRVAAAITGWNGDAQEAVQNAYVKAYRSLRRFRRGAAFRPWLLRIVVNEAHNVRRSERRHERLGARAAERHEAAAAGPDEAVVAREEAATVLARSRDCRTPTGWRSPCATSPSCPTTRPPRSRARRRARTASASLRARRRLQALLEEADD